MAKLDELLRAAGGHAAESMGRVPPPAMHGASPPVAPSTPPRLQGIARSKDSAEIPVDRIVRDPDQPREEFDDAALARLAESLKARGQLQPIRVRWDEALGRYVVLCGERRWRAAGLAGLTTLSCIIVDGPMDPAERLAVQLVENALREDLRPVEQARAFRRLMDGSGWSTHQLARELGIDQSSVSRALRLLDQPEPVQELVEQGALAAATAYEISKLADPAAQQEVAARVVAEGLSRSEAVAAVREEAKGPTRPKGKRASRPRKVTERVLRSSTGYKVTVACRRGIEPEGLLAALEEVAAAVRAELSDAGRGEAA